MAVWQWVRSLGYECVVHHHAHSNVGGGTAGAVGDCGEDNERSSVEGRVTAIVVVDVDGLPEYILRARGRER